MAQTGYFNGSDMLLYVAGKPVGHCTSHTTDFTTETKEHAVKPIASQGKGQSKWKDASVSGLAISISADGLVNYDETENGYAELLKAYAAAMPVEVKCMERGKEEPYLSGMFVIDSLKRVDGAGDDATYSISLKNAGAPTVLDGAKVISKD